MLTESRTHDIPYLEYRVINTLLHSHLDELGDSLRAMIVFGQLLISDDTRDIDILEVIEDWQGPSRMHSESSDDFPMRGNLYLNFLSVSDFQATSTAYPQSAEVQELMQRVLDGYEIIYEQPIGYVRAILTEAASQNKKKHGGNLLVNPLSLKRSRGA